jgi:hypothetical protein
MPLTTYKFDDQEYVTLEDYQWLVDYCDHLVAFSKLACLPKDLENLRAANLKFATENEELRKQLLLQTGNINCIFS